jgi:hypothetical protein
MRPPNVIVAASGASRTLAVVAVTATVAMIAAVTPTA